MPDDPKQKSRWTGWLRAAVALAAGLLLTVLGVGLVAAVGGSDASGPPAGVTPPPPAPQIVGPPVGFGGPGVDPGTPWPEADAAEYREVAQFFTRFGAAVRDPRNDLSDLFWYHDLMPPGPAEESPFGGEDGRSDPERFGQAVVRRERAEWRTWDWAKPEVRRVTRQPDGGRYEAVVWHTAKDGTRVKRRWALMDKFDASAPAPDGADVIRFAALGWEDLHTGVTAWDLAVVEAAVGSRPRKTRDVWRFRDVFAVHRALDAGKIDDAGKAVENLQRARFDPDQQYAVDLAEARYRRRVGDREEALELCEELVKRDRNRVAAHLLLAELLLDAEQYERVKEVVAASAAVVGDDPDALAAKAEAHYRLVETDDATAAFEQVRRYDSFQPRLLNWERRGLPAERKQEVADKLAKAPRPERLFDTLADGAIADEDWAGLAAVAQKFRDLRPADHRGAAKLILAQCRQKKPDEATAAFRDAVGKLKGDERKRLIETFASEMAAVDKAPDAYAAVPDADAPLAFHTLASGLAANTEEWAFEGEPDQAKKKQAAADELAKLIDKHRAKHPDDVWLAYHDGGLRLRAGDHAKAAELFAAALAKVPFADDVAKDFASGYSQLRERQTVALYKLGRGVEAYRELKPPAFVFRRLSALCVQDKNADGLAELLAERDKREPNASDQRFWRGEVNWLRKQYARAAADYRAYLDTADDSDVGTFQWNARERLIRSFVRAGKPDEAAKELRSEDKNVALLALVQIVVGNAGAGEATLWAAADANPNLAPMLYRDEDLGPLLKGAAFVGFRKHFPPPDEKQDERDK